MWVQYAAVLPAWDDATRLQLGVSGDLAGGRVRASSIVGSVRGNPPHDQEKYLFVCLLFAARWVGQEGIGRLVKYTQSSSLVVRTCRISGRKMQS